MDHFDITEINGIVNDLREDFEAIAMPRSAYTLEHLVVRVHEHESQQWLQCVLEMRIKYNTIRRYLINRQKLQREIETLQDDLESQLKLIDLDDLDWALLGATREFMALYAIYRQFGKRYTHEEIEAGQVEYWHNRLIKQAGQDVFAAGRVSVGNLEALRQIGFVPAEKDGRIEFMRGNNGAVQGHLSQAPK